MDAKEKCFINQTANYQLNQWDPGDRILREEFNEDNARIDAAIARLEAACPYRVMKQIITSAEARVIDIDMTDIAWQEYLQVWLFIRSTGSCSYLLQTNGLSTGYMQHTIGSNSSSSSQVSMVSAACLGRGFTVFHTPCPQGKVGCLVFSYNGSDHNTAVEGVSNVTWEEFETLNLIGSSGSNQVPAGTTLTFCGVRG